MNDKQKKGAGAAAHRAEESQTQAELMAELNRLQAAIDEQCREVDRYYARKCEIAGKRPLPETDLSRRVNAARSMLHALNAERNAHYLFSAGIVCGVTQGRQADRCDRLVFQSGLFFWYFLDGKGRWFMRLRSGEWRREKWGLVLLGLKSIGITHRSESPRGNSEADLVKFFFTGHRIDLPAELEAALLAGEKMTKMEIMARSSQSFIAHTGAMKTMRREFGETEGWRF